MKKRPKYDVIREALDILGLPERATMKTIRFSYKELIKKWHPDTCGEESEKCKAMTQKIIRAYKILLSYCNNYPYSFTKEAVNATLSPEEWFFERFGEDPLWRGNKGKEGDES
ncbi:MAG: J domain-containing protein [Deltaproteobacteria bacterium]|nr:J domain-containing protein [Deltaproteobacteria bacterium]